MSRDASISFDWADGNYKFRLAIGQIRELQEACDAGPPEILERLVKDRWRLQDIAETIRLGLVGGKQVTAVEANKLVTRYVYGQPLQESVLPAIVVLSAVITGVPDEPLKKAMGTEQAPSHSPEESSASVPSTVSAP